TLVPGEPAAPPTPRAPRPPPPEPVALPLRCHGVRVLGVLDAPARRRDRLRGGLDPGRGPGPLGGRTTRRRGPVRGRRFPPRRDGGGPVRAQAARPRGRLGGARTVRGRALVPLDGGGRSALRGA